MKALEFLEKFRTARPGFVCGSYCLHLLHGIDYNDIDFYTPLTYDIIDMTDQILATNVPVKKEILLDGKLFILGGENYIKQFCFASYKCLDFDDVPVNIIFIRLEFKSNWKWIYSLLGGFDMDILRVAISNKSPLNKVDIRDDYYLNCVKNKRIPVIVRNNKFASWHDVSRIERYKQRFPDYEFYKPL